MRTPAAHTLTLLLAGLCSPVVARAQPRTAPAADAAASPAETERRAQVVARVGDQAITVGEFEDMLNEAPGPVRQRYLAPAERRTYLEHLVTTFLLAGEARRQGLDRNPEVSASVRRILSQRLEQRAVLETVTAESIPASEVSAYYQAHVADYQQPEYRRATVIITADRETAARVVADARAARGDLRRVRELVRQHSVDEPSKAHDGDVFYFQRSGAPTGEGQPVDPALAAAVFGLAREMDVTPQPVALTGGRFGVGVLTGTRPALRRDPTDPGVVATIRGFLVRDRRAQRTAAMLQAARDRLHPEVHEERLELIHLPPGDLGNLPPFDPHGAAHPNTH
jgi:peptidyl-prolyl cis-trans isomerase C